jgi:hypothetical protein
MDLTAVDSNFHPTHPEARHARIVGCRLPAEDTSDGRAAVAVSVDGDGTIWLDVERDLEPFICWLRTVA